MQPTRRAALAGATAAALSGLAACSPVRQGTHPPTDSSTPSPTPTSASPGVRKGFNISPRRADYAAGYSSPWTGLWLNWDWAGKIQRDIDLGAGLGASAVRIIGAPQAVLSGQLPQETYFARLQQVLDHCERRSLQLYPAGGTLRGWSEGDLPDARLQDLFTAQAALLEERKAAVFGFDIINELVNAYRSFDPTGLRVTVAGWARTIKASAPSIPLTVSNIGRNADWGYTAFPELDPELDFYDFHLLDAMPADVVRAWRAHKPVVIGEVDVRRTLAGREARYRSIVRSALSGGAEAVFAWDITSNDFGLFDADGGNLDPGLAAGFATVPDSHRR